MAKVYRKCIDNLRPLERYLYIKILEDRLQRKLKVKI